MEVVYRCYCRIDVHKSLIVTCLRTGGEQELREFDTITFEMANWPTKADCEIAAMGSRHLQALGWEPDASLANIRFLTASLVRSAAPGRFVAP